MQRKRRLLSNGRGTWNSFGWLFKQRKRRKTDDVHDPLHPPLQVPPPPLLLLLLLLITVTDTITRNSSNNHVITTITTHLTHIHTLTIKPPPPFLTPSSLSLLACDSSTESNERLQHQLHLIPQVLLPPTITPTIPITRTVLMHRTEDDQLAHI